MIGSFAARARRYLRSLEARAIVLAVFLVLTLAVTASLAYEAWSAGRAQQVAAERTLSEYARFAALTYRQRIQARLYTSIVPVIRSVADPRTPGVAGPLPDVMVLRDAAERAVRCHCGPALEPTLYFRVTPNRDVTVTGTTTTPREQTMLRGLPDSIGSALMAANDWDYGTVYDVSSTQPRLLVVSLRRGPGGVPVATYGFAVPLSKFIQTVFASTAASPSLLPLTPAERLPNDDVFGVTLVGAGTRTQVSRHLYEPQYTASVPLTGVAGFTSLVVALNPSLAPRLLIGGVPTSRVPLLVSLLVLCSLLLTTIIVLAWRAIQLARMRSDFVASISHELRTPLAQILLFGETLSFGRMTTRREVRRAADIIVGESRRLMQLVDNVLLFGRGERRVAQKSLEPVSLVPLIRDVVTAFTPLATAAEVVLRTARLESCVVRADRAELRQLLLNLLDNAVKYGPRGQTITIGLARAGPSGAERARIWVEDEGPGIPELDRQRVWEPFVRLPRDLEGETAGSGIGLAVVRQIVERHGGSASIETAPAGGACVVVELPAERPPVAIAPPRVASNTAADA